MTPPRCLELSVLPEDFAIVRLAASAPTPNWATQGSFFSVTRTSEELSIVCATQHVPEKLRTEIHWRALKVHGPFALSEVGVLAALAAPLAQAQVSLFVISTFDTDYLLVKADQLPAAMEALEHAGHKIFKAGAKSRAAKIEERRTPQAAS